jgi:hypothetical protein
MKMKMKLTTGLGLLVLAMTLTSEVRAAGNPVDGTLTVTPVATVSLDLAPTFYAFGTVALSVSTRSMTMQGLHNVGTVGVTMDKRIRGQGTWTAGTAVGADQFILYAATSTAATPPVDTVFTTNARFGALNAVSGLNDGSGATNGALPLLSNTTIWYRLDMPSSVSSQTPQTITVRYTGTAQ